MKMTTHETSETKQKMSDSLNIEDVNDGGLRLRHGSRKSTKKNPLGDGIDCAKHLSSDLKVKTESCETSKSSGAGGDSDADRKPKRSKDVPICDCNTYWLTRIVLLRSVAFLCCVAFTVALHQNRALIGKRGLLPADKHLSDIRRHVNNDRWRIFTFAPTVLWLHDYVSDLDQLLDIVAYAGLFLSVMVFTLGAANMPIIFTIWALYHSLVNVGQRWYSFGWESQLLETLFLTMLLCPVHRILQLPRETPTPVTTMWLHRWLIFRIMLGAGLIKLRGDRCWQDLTCMKYHYQTQPVPNPLSYYMHQSPMWFHKFEVLVNHFVELPAPFLVLVPHRGIRQLGGVIQVAFQLLLIMSGNLSFLNWITMLPCIACFDDASLAWLFSSTTKWQVYKLQQASKSTTKPQPKWSDRFRRLFDVASVVFIAYLSVPIVQNLLSSRQQMNTSFDPLRIVNTYGAFGSITKQRTELIVQGTYDKHPESPHAVWLEYEFKCKPGNITRRPCIISPYHYRLDWLMWFAAFQSYQQNSWLVHLVAKLLVNDDRGTSLLAHNPFKYGDPPKWIRVEHYRYSYTKIGSKAARRGVWWKRKRIDSYLPPLSLKALEPFLKNLGWAVPRLPSQGKTREPGNVEINVNNDDRMESRGA